MTEYIKSPLFIKDLKRTHLFGRDYILTDFDWEESIENHFSFSEKSNHSLLEDWEEIIASSEKILIILSEFSFPFVTELCKKYSEKMTIIDLYSGMGSKGRKIKGGEMGMNYEKMEFYEPFDKKNFFDILKEVKGGNIIKIPYQLFEEDIFKVEDIVLIEKKNLKMISSLSLLEYGYIGNQGTLLTTGGNLPLILQVGDLLKDENINMDLFAFSKFSAWNTEYILQSFERTQKVLLLLDEENPERYFHDLQQFCKEKSYQFEFILPQYQNITTIFDEYYIQQAHFDAESICERIKALGV